MSELIKSHTLANLVAKLVGGLETSPYAAPEQRPALRVTSHVARDLLQNAAYFNSVPKVITEYATNAIDNGVRGESVTCEITVNTNALRIADNANGMSHTELFNFFQMHGENQQRRRGRTVRGKFGTGKSAAFGIANSLRIETVQEGKRNVVELQRAEVEAAQDGQPIPVREIIVNERTRAPHGTTIIITDLHVKHVEAGPVQAYLEKTMGRHLSLHRVTVNGTRCQFHEPSASKIFRFKVPRELQRKSGSATCVLKIARAPLRREENVVAILCNGYLHAVTLAGKQADPFVEYLFGEIEVPMLDADNGPIPAFDNSRNLTLNPQNPLVRALLAWLAACIEKVRLELVARDKRRRYSKEMRLLRKVAGEIQTFLNEDFRIVQEKLPWATMRGFLRHHKPKSDRVQNGHTPRTLIERGRVLVKRILKGAQEDNGAAQTLDHLRRGHRVEFELNYVRLGAAAARARYITNRRTIYLNRDHPQLRVAETEAGIESLTFRMLSFDIAFTEYALAVVSQLADQGIEVADPIDAGEMVQEILDRLGRKTAEYCQQNAAYQTAVLQPALTDKDQASAGNGKMAESSTAPAESS